MASARQVAKLVAVCSSISSGAVRTLLGRTMTTRQGLDVVPDLLRLVCESITAQSTPDEETLQRISAVLCRLILRYGTLRRSIEALASGRRRHPLISADKAHAWMQVMSVTPSAVEATLQRQSALRVSVTKWAETQGARLDVRLSAFESWMEGPLPGSDDEDEFPILAEAASETERMTPSPRPAPEPAETIEPTEPAAAPQEPAAPAPVQQDGSALTYEGEETPDITQVRALLASHKRPGRDAGELSPTAEQREAIERLRTSSDAYGRAVAAVASRDFVRAEAFLDALTGRVETGALHTLRGDRLYLEERYDESVHHYREAAHEHWEPAQLTDLALALLHAVRGSREDACREAVDLLRDALAKHPPGSPGAAYAELMYASAMPYSPDMQRGEALRESVERLQSAADQFEEHGDMRAWAEARYQLGNVWQEMPTGDRRINIERAIACYEQSLKHLTREAAPEAWASVQNAAGHACERLPTGNRGLNLERAIACFSAALTVRTKDNSPVHWARLQNNIGNVWVQFPGGDRKQNIERAIAYQQAALDVWSAHNRRGDWATTQSNLGNAWALLPCEDEERERNVRRAISCYKAALEVRTRTNSPLEWATTQNNLGSALLQLPAGKKGVNVKDAIAAYESALEVRTKQAYPVEWAKTQANLGNAYLKLPYDKQDNLAEAVAYYDAALEIFSSERFPAQHRVISARRREARGMLSDIER
ncbi:MAG: tetratricopeptide repeat protein [Planctomycetota bacterium]